MSVPQQLHHLVSELGDSLVKALAEDGHCRDLASSIQAKGYSLVLILEAAPTSVSDLDAADMAEPEAEQPFSEDDLRLMKSFKIRMD
jgi:hypothetical protein